MQLGDHFTVLLGSGCRDDMHNQMGRITLARFGEVSLIANPLRLTFDAVMRLKVKRGANSLSGGRNVSCATPMYRALSYEKWMRE